MGLGFGSIGEDPISTLPDETTTTVSVKHIMEAEIPRTLFKAVVCKTMDDAVLPQTQFEAVILNID